MLGLQFAVARSQSNFALLVFLGVPCIGRTSASTSLLRSSYKQCYAFYSRLLPIELRFTRSLGQALHESYIYSNELTFLVSSVRTSTCSLLSKPIFKSSSMIGSLKVIDFSHCPFGCFSS